MRTTITLDDKLFHRLEMVAERSHSSFKKVVNETLQAGLSLTGCVGEPGPPFEVRPTRSRIRSGIDEGRLNALLDESEADDFSAKEHRR